MSVVLEDAKRLLREVELIADRKAVELRTINRYAALDFSPFQFIDGGEVQTTHLLSFFLDPTAIHGQGELFQQSFLTKLRERAPALPAGRYKSMPEKRHDGVRQIDLLLIAQDAPGVVCIENKHGARDQDRQLHDYNAYLDQHFAGKPKLLVYLTPTARDPKPHSLEPTDRERPKQLQQYCNLTYKDFLVPLLDEWIALAFPNKVKEFLGDWKNYLNQHVLHISPISTSKVMTEALVDYLLQNPKYLNTAALIQSALDEANQRLRQSLMAALDKLGNELGLQPQRYDYDPEGFGKREDGALYILTSPKWGRYMLSFEFKEQTLAYGVRFERYQGKSSKRALLNYPEEIGSALLAAVAGKIANGLASSEWYPVWVPIFASQTALDQALMNGSFLERVTPGVSFLKEKLDQLADAHPI